MGARILGTSGVRNGRLVKWEAMGRTLLGFREG